MHKISGRLINAGRVAYFYCDAEATIVFDIWLYLHIFIWIRVRMEGVYGREIEREHRG